ncbi:quinone-dependent dihydroorotate dehydrogenase [Limnospira fusiformis KN01]|uniref:quinone-dependent dihydroorotate dehydrogenase n=1 Tax=Limnospira TaxID=2596745 RepID=UPI001658ACA8|nr:MULTISPECIES: quinone-dependent dihydroorotate dehydrogenase [Limnospira]MDT9201264.1 quinone-dependent dihydroorotate dehydrogenase [Limnospira sp. PMC 1042.18]MDT9236347.1 quinone-dependent dihydroorotate dehydrogenase [Limnospira sp. PMC 917.15]MDY7051589.1 quinone-dependent dihydroorotate dehydrogenase [Limnospira fusiformis LS22]ULB48234.1 quinone-dependent dihydroorotate dehydrogenase [Limnospira fusiformis KN01]
MDLYQSLLKPILFKGLKVDPEWAHHQTLELLHWIDTHKSNLPLSWLESQLQPRFSLVDPRLQQTLWGLNFINPVGLAAGFDKDGVAAGLWGSFGFGFTELGTVTLHPQPGNPRPRLFRLLEDEAVLNRMGFNNQGAATLADRLQNYTPSSLGPTIPLGINLGKSKITPLEEAASDYLGSFQLLRDLGDYFVVNVSSPNTPGLRSLQGSTELNEILTVLQQENIAASKPLFIKIAPDLEWKAIDDIIELARTHNLAGIIATNTTISRDNLKTQWLPQTGNPITSEAGGISGAPLRERSTAVIRHIWEQTNGEIPIIGVGGIFTAEDAWEKITAGACLLQVYTGWVYEGPLMVHRLLTGLLQKLEHHGLNHISQAIGVAGSRVNHISDIP